MYASINCMNFFSIPQKVQKPPNPSWSSCSATAPKTMGAEVYEQKLQHPVDDAIGHHSIPPEKFGSYVNNDGNGGGAKPKA
ncbi:hypothetical protein CJ030_MR1G002799 [Morella rubra]|uniref:Uncharacterized protein n=1 Tax=Morella rubra TaxID=262757 RepID=A0A6A1WM12_9ROSI|nr:hypothetical protein CJ030_MR1G002799 [Morella rubra]